MGGSLSAKTPSGKVLGVTGCFGAGCSLPAAITWLLISTFTVFAGLNQRSFFADAAMQPYLNAFKTSFLRNGSFRTPLMAPAANLLPIPSFLLPRLYASKVPRATDSKTDTESAAQRQKIVLNDDDLIETFVRGSGPGGQCINKRSNCVDLRHIPTGLRVQVSCEQYRLKVARSRH
jgi:hypothetical protein